MGDIHGNSRRFDSLIEKLDLQPEDTLYVLGDVIDRYPDGIRLLRRLMAMPQAHLILGNHEYMMLQAIDPGFAEWYGKLGLDGDACLQRWYRNGGNVTHAHLKRLRKSAREVIFRYLRALPLFIDLEVNGKMYKLVHAAHGAWFDPAVDTRYHTPTEYAVWKRLEAGEFPKTPYHVIFGHTGTYHYTGSEHLFIWHGTGQTGVDCGCGYPDPPLPGSPHYGRLACLRLEDGKEFYSDETDSDLYV